MGANDGIRSKLKKAAQEANKAYRQGALQQRVYLRKIEEATKKADDIGIIWRQRLNSIPDGETIWSKFADGTEEAQQKIILKYPNVDIRKWVDETAKLGLKFKAANDIVDQLSLKEHEIYEKAKAAKVKEKLAIDAYNQYVSKKAANKEIGGEEYKLFKAGMMNVAKMISKM